MKNSCRTEPEERPRAVHGGHSAYKPRWHDPVRHGEGSAKTGSAVQAPCLPLRVVGWRCHVGPFSLDRATSPFAVQTRLWAAQNIGWWGATAFKRTGHGNGKPCPSKRPRSVGRFRMPPLAFWVLLLLNVWTGVAQDDQRTYTDREFCRLYALNATGAGAESEVQRPSEAPSLPPEANYRLGDIVRQASQRRLEYGAQWHLEHFPYSIAAAYLRRTSKEEDYETLLDVLATYKPWIRPPRTALVVHLRTGDVIERSAYSVDRLLEAQRWYQPIPGRNFGIPYVRPASYYRRAARHYRYKLRDVVLVVGGCGRMMVKSREYVCRVQDLLRSYGFQVLIREGMDPDEDFAFMCRAKHFVPGGGGFDHVVSTVNELLVGPQYRPDQVYDTAQSSLSPALPKTELLGGQGKSDPAQGHGSGAGHGKRDPKERVTKVVKEVKPPPVKVPKIKVCRMQCKFTCHTVCS